MTLYDLLKTSNLGKILLDETDDIDLTQYTSNIFDYYNQSIQSIENINQIIKMHKFWSINTHYPYNFWKFLFEHKTESSEYIAKMLDNCPVEEK